ncbi:unnamed protein product [Echinostoma caproni]|uniref:Uncharacterized protein n=1 Tax=Echinostoma caproni TaxID=27848 RepID=A0A3P8ID01_9TREM|nr:unnamed protein product [Echinostoma caproni]
MTQINHFNQSYPGPRSPNSSPVPDEVVPIPLSDSKVLTGTHICNGCELYANQYEQPRDEEMDLTPDQATLRREKSRVAAKLRRQKENQALVKLRLALPIQSSKLPPTAGKDGSQSNDANASTVFNDSYNHQRQKHQEHAHSRVLTECALSCVPNYRAANSISRQHHLAAPEFEKAVTVRLAGNALCLYDWLYTSPSQTAQLIHSQITKARTPDATQQSSEFSNSSGRARSQHEASPNSFSSDAGTNTTGPVDSAAIASCDPLSPNFRSRSRSRKLSNTPKRLSKTSLQLIPPPAFYAELWARSDTDTSSFATLTTLLPPGPNVAQLLGHLLLDEAESVAPDSTGSSDGGEQSQTGQLPATTPVRQSFNESSELVSLPIYLHIYIYIYIYTLGPRFFLSSKRINVAPSLNKVCYVRAVLNILVVVHAMGTIKSVDG